MSQSHPHNQAAHPEREGLDTPPAEATPSAGRDGKGRFVKGNPDGPGNPFARQVAKLRAALVDCVTEEDMLHIAEELLVQAKLGKLAAIKLLFQYVLGKPAATVNPDTLDVEEWQQLIRPIPQIMKELPDTLITVPVEAATRMVQIVQPFIVDKFAAMLDDEPQTAEGKGMTKVTEDKKEKQESKKSDLPAIRKAKPSTNGNGRRKKKARPSANGACNGTQSVPPWLAEIAARTCVVTGMPRDGRFRGR
jgi:hypothetical protein